MDAAAAGDEVVVTNGVYPGGVTVTNPLKLLSANGPQFTVINGGGTNQCVSLTDGSSLTGFTVTSGYAYQANGGGVVCSSTNAFLTNCVFVGNSSYNNGGGAYGGALYNCTLTGNAAFYGGGAYGSFLSNCILSSNAVNGILNQVGGINAASEGGGAYGCTLQNCTLSGNSSAPGAGGGASSSTLYNCNLTGNSANSGAAADSCTLYNCALTGNPVLSRASAGVAAASGSALYNCTLTGNPGGGVSDCQLYNCIVYFNPAAGGANYDSSSTLDYCCTTPPPTNGIGNLAVDPQLASAFYLSAGSPCRGAGSAAYATGTDIDGEPWNDPPSIGCVEYDPGALTGPLTVGVLASYTNVAVRYPLSLTALIEGRATASVWDFGDGTVATNEPYTAHAWTQIGDYPVTSRAFNESNPQGVSSTMTIHVGPPLFYVAAASTNPQPPYTSWGTAATNIQDAVAAAPAGGQVIVSNGVYAGEVNMTNPLAVLSVNGPDLTLIDGGAAAKCAFLCDGASLTGFTLINGYSFGNGAGLTCSTTNAFVTNCVIEGNAAYGSGGGAYGGTLYNCALIGNLAVYGGGAYGCALYNCSLTSNSFPDIALPSFVLPTGGGADNCILSNCTLSANSTRISGGGAAGCVLYHCTLASNSATYYGGGASYNETGGNCTLYNCTVTGNFAGFAGGTYGGTLYNCTLISNSAKYDVGGAYGGALYNCALAANSGGWAGEGAALYNCTVTGNSGGGASDCVLYNSIVYLNTTSGESNYDSACTLNYCCTTPLPASGLGNITNDPQFLDYAGGNLRLQSNSPCINAGNNADASTGTDLDGNPRIVGGTVDMGAYEYQTPVSMISYAWLDQYGLPIATITDAADFDGTGMNVYQDWVAGLNPTNPASVLVMLPPTVTNLSTGVRVSWQSVAGANYFLNFTTDLASSFTTIATNIAGQPGTTSYADTNAIGPGPFFYRVGVPGP